jgi:hypothetical protein
MPKSVFRRAKDRDHRRAKQAPRLLDEERSERAVVTYRKFMQRTLPETYSPPLERAPRKFREKFGGLMTIEEIARLEGDRR